MSALPDGAISSTANYERAARALEGTGWELVAAGDWSWVYEDRHRSCVARLTPWDPAYEVFIELCLELPGCLFVPRVFDSRRLAGGGSLTVIERLEPVTREEARPLLAALKGETEIGAHTQLAGLLAAVERADARGRASIPFWRGLDDNPRNVMRDAAGRPKVIDLFYVGGPDLTRALRHDASAVAERIPLRFLWAFSELPAFRRQPLGRDVLRSALLRVGPEPR